ncbi:MAG TPA: hemolysin family protein [Pseudomonadales bacterium]|nr:hemolysin family protein [Pseudomonadales bacterium]
MELLLLYLFLAIGVSFLCSVSEAVLLSTRPSFIASLDPNSRKARLLSDQQHNMDKHLAAILTANTIAHTVGAAGVGAQASYVFGDEYFGLISAVLTLLILIFSEIIPKTIGANYWKQLAGIMCVIIHWMTRLLYPLVWASGKVTQLISSSNEGLHTFSREEVTAMIDIGKREGVIDHNEHKIVSNLLMLRQLSVRDLMTPRTVLVTASRQETVAMFFSLHAESSFSRIPIYGAGHDDISGYVLKTDLLIAQANDQFDRQLHEFEREFLVISDRLTAMEGYKQLMREKSHIALVVDEYGTVQGLLSLEDIFETLIGMDIMDEMDKVEDLRALAKTLWKERITALGVDLSDVSADKSVRGKSSV